MICGLCDGEGVYYSEEWKPDYINGGYVIERESVCSECFGMGVIDEDEDSGC